MGTTHYMAILQLLRFACRTYISINFFFSLVKGLCNYKYFIHLYVRWIENANIMGLLGELYEKLLAQSLARSRHSLSVPWKLQDARLILLPRGPSHLLAYFIPIISQNPTQPLLTPLLRSLPRCPRLLLMQKLGSHHPKSCATLAIL